MSGDRPEVTLPPEVAPQAKEPLAEDSEQSLLRLDEDSLPPESEGGALGQPARKVYTLPEEIVPKILHPAC